MGTGIFAGANVQAPSSRADGRPFASVRNRASWNFARSTNVGRHYNYNANASVSTLALTPV